MNEHDSEALHTQLQPASPRRVRLGENRSLRDGSSPRRKTYQTATVKGSRSALIKNPQDLTGGHRTSLAEIAATNTELYGAYLLKSSSGPQTCHLRLAR